MKKLFLFVCGSILLIQSGYSQQKLHLFKDINTDIKPLLLDEFKIVGDSLIYFVAKENTSFFRIDTISIYASNGSATFLATQFNSGEIEKFGGTSTHYFFRHNTDLYSLKGQTRTLIAPIGLTSNEKFSHRNKFLFQKANNGSDGFDLCVTDGTLAGTAIVSYVGYKQVNFLGTANEYVYYVLNDNVLGKREIWKFNTTNDEATFLDYVPYGYIFTLNNKGAASNYFYFQLESFFYVADNQSGQLRKIPLNNIQITQDLVINNRLYAELQTSDNSRLGIHKFNTTTNSFDAVNINAPTIYFAHQYNGNVYGWGQSESGQYDKLLKTDSLFQNYALVPTPLYLTSELETQFFFKDSYYRVYHYSREYSHLRTGARITKSDGITLQSSVILDSFDAGLHQSSLEAIKFEDFAFAKNQFFFSVTRDRSSWGSSNSYIIGPSLWRSNLNDNLISEVFKAGKSTLNAGIKGLSADKNDLFFFADTNNGFQLMTTDGSSKNLKPYVDSTFVNLDCHPTDQPIYRFGKKLFFHHSPSGSSDGHLAVTDGTKKGTKYISYYPNQSLGGITNVKIHHNLLYFLSGSLLFSTDGDTTRPIFVSSMAERVYDYYLFNNHLYLIQVNGNKTEVWKINENTQVKQKIYEADFVCCSDYFSFIGAINNKLLFGLSINSQQHLFTSDGTSEGTNLLTVISTINSESVRILKSILFKNNYYVFTSSHIVKTDGTQAGTSTIYQASVSLGAISAAENFILFYNEAYGTTKTIVIFDGVNFTPMPQYSDDFDWPTHASKDAAFFRYNKKTYITYGTPDSTYLLCDDIITSLATLSNYTFLNISTWKYGSELWTLNKCEQNLSLSGPFSSDHIFTAKQNIHAIQQPTNANVIYRAGNSIQLAPGFKTTNAVFKAEIETCVD
jgi:hypothetical protein